MNTNTFEGWIKLGYFIKKGSKSIGRNVNGIPIFDISQTVFIPNIKHSNADYDCDNTVEGTDVGQLTEGEIQDAAIYRKMMFEKVKDNASKGCKISGSYLALLNSHPLAMSVHEDGDYSSDMDDLEPIF